MAKCLGVFALCAAVFSASPAHAGYSHSTDTTIDEVVVLHDGSFYFQLHDPVCSAAGKTTVAYAYKGVAVNGVVPDDAAMDRLLKVGMAAYLSGTSVRIHAEDGGSHWGCLLGAISVR